MRMKARLNMHLARADSAGYGCGPWGNAAHRCLHLHVVPSGNAGCFMRPSRLRETTKPAKGRRPTTTTRVVPLPPLGGRLGRRVRERHVIRFKGQEALRPAGSRCPSRVHLEKLWCWGGFSSSQEKETRFSPLCAGWFWSGLRGIQTKRTSASSFPSRKLFSISR